MIVGLALVAVVIAGIALLGRHRNQAPPVASPYSAKLRTGAIKMSQADNMAGSTVTYLDFDIANTGTETVIGASVEAVFKDSLGQVVQREILPIKVLQPSPIGGYPDLYDLAKAPLGPGQEKPARIILDRVSSSWSQSVPELQIVSVTLK